MRTAPEAGTPETVDTFSRELESTDPDASQQSRSAGDVGLAGTRFEVTPAGRRVLAEGNEREAERRQSADRVIAAEWEEQSRALADERRQNEKLRAQVADLEQLLRLREITLDAVVRQAGEMMGARQPIAALTLHEQDRMPAIVCNDGTIFARKLDRDGHRWCEIEAVPGSRAALRQGISGIIERASAPAYEVPSVSIGDVLDETTRAD